MELLRQQTALARFGELALRSDDLDALLTEACQLAAHALETDLAKVVQLQDDGKTFLVRAGVGWKPGVVGMTLPPMAGDTSEGHALLTGEPMISPDIQAETRFPYAPFLIDNGGRAIANVPIIGGLGRPPFGILQVDNLSPRHFSESDMAFLQSYANLIAAAVERMRINGALREGEARFRLALDAGELGSWDFNLVDRTATHSPRYDQIFGYNGASPSWSYDTFLNHVEPEDRAHVADMFRQTVRGDADWSFQCRIRRADDGAIRWIEARGRPYGGRDDRPTHLQGIIADITARKHVEGDFQRSHEALEAIIAERTGELTAANAKLRHEAEERERVEGTLRQAHKMDAIGQLTGGIAHDFNNLLTGIIGSIDLLRKRVSQGRIGELDRYFDAALASANRAAALTHRLLAFSRRQPLAPCATDVNRLVVGMEDLFRRTVGPAIHIDTRLSAALWLTKCDPNQLENALLNLVINARDAMPDGGRVTIATANVSAPADATNEGPVGDLVTVTVTDSGAGMTPEVMARAFEPFFTTKPVGQGTGLGLAMIYGFAQQSGGHVDLRSKPGQGLAVVVSLPRTFAKAGTAPVVAAARGLSLARAGATVLVVEDEPSVRLVICDALAEQGYAVREAADGRTALRHLESGVVTDLLVTDLGLPGGFSGWDLAEAARPGRPDLKVLFITGLAVKEGTGADVMVHAQVLRKPFTTDTLLARVHDLLGGDAAVPSTPALNRGMRPTPPLDRGAD